MISRVPSLADRWAKSKDAPKSYQQMNTSICYASCSVACQQFQNCSTPGEIEPQGPESGPAGLSCGGKLDLSPILLWCPRFLTQLSWLQSSHTDTSHPIPVFKASRLLLRSRKKKICTCPGFVLRLRFL